MCTIPQMPNTLDLLSDLSTIFLDMDGTLLDLNFDYVFWTQHLPRRYCEIHDIDAEEGEHHVNSTLKAVEGTLDWYCTDHWSGKFNVDILSLKQELAHLVNYRPGTSEFLNHVADSDLHVVLLTNAHPDVVTMKHELTGLLDHVDAMVSSHMFAAPKESQQFWDALRAHLDFDAPNSMLIDDSHSVLQAAHEHGRTRVLCVSHPNSSLPGNPHPEFDNIIDLSQLIPNVHG